MTDKIIEILNKNKMEDLTRFLQNRQCLNKTNICFVYLFHIFQTAGLLTTAIAQSFNMSTVVWIGIGINALATLIHIFQQTNNKISKHMLDNIVKIKNGTYVDESVLVNEEPEESEKKHASV